MYKLSICFASVNRPELDPGFVPMTGVSGYNADDDILSRQLRRQCCTGIRGLDIILKTEFCILMWKEPFWYVCSYGTIFGNWKRNYYEFSSSAWKAPKAFPSPGSGRKFSGEKGTWQRNKQGAAQQSKILFDFKTRMFYVFILCQYLLSTVRDALSKTSAAEKNKIVIVVGLMDQSPNSRQGTSFPEKYL